MLLGLKARAILHADKPGCGATDIHAPDGPGGDDRLLVALVAGSEGEGRLLHQVRQWHVSTEDAKSIIRLVGGITDASAARLARAKRSAAQLVRDPKVWAAIEAVAWQLAQHGVVDHSMVGEAVSAAGLVPVAVGNGGLEPPTFSL